MWFFNILVLTLLCVAQGKSVKSRKTPQLEWPTTYTFTAMKIYETAGITVNYNVWRTPTKSRVDLNDYYTTIIEATKPYGFKYEINPRSDENSNSELVCTMEKGTLFDRQRPKDYLPDIDDLEEDGKEVLYQHKCTKFYSKIETADDSYTYENKLWAYYKNKTWIPVRYEKKDYNSELGILDLHEIWEFASFGTIVDDKHFKRDLECYPAVSKQHVKENLSKANNKDDDENAFTAFQKKHGRKYSKEEYETRKDIFNKKLRLVSEVNRQNLGYKLAVNHLSDRTKAEMFRHMGRLPRPEGEVAPVPFPYSSKELIKLAETLPDAYDARMYGLVTPVLNQEDCGSCWTFGTTAAAEGAIARSTGRLVTLSKQALLDCAWSYDAEGCNGGYDYSAYKWMMKNGIPSAAEYGGYTDSVGYCRVKNMTKTIPISGFSKVTAGSAIALKVALINHGPLSVAVNADGPGFTEYSSGIYYHPECESSSLNHEVAVVGYAEENGETYWIIKNSWGKSWGIDGYMLISARDNNCGVMTDASYPIV